VNRFDLYELAAQTPLHQARFLAALHGAGATVLAEDFSGPAAIARAWLTLSEDHRAIIVDRDPEPLDHAADRLSRAHGGAMLERLTVLNDDVLAAKYRADVIAALNFAVCELRTRAELMTYLRHGLLRLEARGILVADLYGGASAMIPGVTRQTIDTDDGPIVYEWEQREVDPLTGMVANVMHFTLPDGAPLREAFVYHWRLWSIPELRDAMREAGFRRTEVHTALGGAIDEEGNLLVRAASSDDRPDEPSELDEDELESVVAYVVGRA
jgi:hypothetical protein